MAFEDLADETLTFTSPLSGIVHQLWFKSPSEKQAWLTKLQGVVDACDVEGNDRSESVVQMTGGSRSYSQFTHTRLLTSTAVKNPDYSFVITTIVPVGGERSSKSKVHNAFHINVTHKRKQWSLLKRMEDFEVLHQQLKTRFPSINQTARLPDKKSFNASDVSQRNKQMQLAEMYLNSLNHLVGIWNLDFVHEFLQKGSGLDEDGMHLTDTDTDTECDDGITGVEDEGKDNQMEDWLPVIKAFNRKASEGVAMMKEKGIANTPEEIAGFLHVADGLDKDRIGEYLGTKKNAEVLNAFVSRMDFTSITIEEALRIYLRCFRLFGEADAIDRCMQSFAERYDTCNPGEFSGKDTSYVLAFALIMLNTDAHNPDVKKKMTKAQFLGNLAQVDTTLSDAYLGYGDLLHSKRAVAE